MESDAPPGPTVRTLSAQTPCKKGRHASLFQGYSWLEAADCGQVDSYGEIRRQEM